MTDTLSIVIICYFCIGVGAALMNECGVEDSPSFINLLLSLVFVGLFWPFYLRHVWVERTYARARAKLRSCCECRPSIEGIIPGCHCVCHD